MSADITPPGGPDIAQPDEILETFTELMRSEKPAERMKAAEQLAKYYNLFSPHDEAAAQPEGFAEIEALMKELQHDCTATDHGEQHASAGA